MSEWTGSDFDANVNRLKACEHIADGDEGWQALRNECPSTAAVARLRDDLEAAQAEIARLRGIVEAYEEGRRLSQALRDQSTGPVALDVAEWQEHKAEVARLRDSVNTRPSRGGDPGAGSILGQAAERMIFGDRKP